MFFQEIYKKVILGKIIFFQDTSPLRGWLPQNILKGPRNSRLIGTWDKEDKDGKEFEPTRGEKLVSGDARIAKIANKTKHICG